MSFFLSRVMHPNDFAYLGDEAARVDHALNMFNGVAGLQHPARRWEYSMALASLGSRSDIPGKRIIDVGCSCSVLPGLLVWSGAHVTGNDASDHCNVLERTAEIGADSRWAATHGGTFRFVQGDFKEVWNETFDAVLCISVIEHDRNDEEFFLSLLRSVAPGGSLFLTTDFHPSGKAMVPNPGHERTYNKAMMEELIGMADGFETPGGYDYHYHGDFVSSYSFASLHLRRSA